MIKFKHILSECNECGRDWNHGHDHEAGMAKNELRDMISNASKIDQMVGEGDDLPGWVSAYISLAADYMHSVAEYLGGESSRMQEPGPGYSVEEARVSSDKDSRIDYVAGHLQQAWNLGKGNNKIDFHSVAQTIVDDMFDEEHLDEKKKPSAGLTKKQKSAVAKKAVAGKDIGKKGPGFEKVAKAAEKKYGSKEAGQKVAAAAMWKSVKRK